MTSLLHDLRFAFRMLGKERAFTAVAVLTLTFALGANTAIFSVVNAILLRPLPYANAGKIIKVGTFSVVTGETDDATSYPNLADLRAQSKTLDSLAMYIPTTSFVWNNEESQRIFGTLADYHLFRVLGTKPEFGRTYTAKEDAQGAASVVVISHELWKRQFNADRRIIGQQVRFGSAKKPRTVIGVMPEGFQFPIQEERVDYWMPLVPDTTENFRNERAAFGILSVARLRDGVTFDAAKAEVDVIGRRLLAQHVAANAGTIFRVNLLQNDLVKDVRPALLLLLGAVVVVLLIGCANVANLLLARAAARRREMAVRAAIGASRGRIMAQLLVESVVLSLVAAVCGVLLAAWGIDVLKALAPRNIPRIDSVSLDLNVLGFTFALAVVTAIIFGLAPALSASKTDLNETLKEGTRGSTEGRGRNRVRNVLVTASIALSLVLLVGAGLLMRSFMRVTSVDPGFNYRNAMAMDLSIRAGIKGDKEILAAMHRMLDALRGIPGVTAVGATDLLPLSGNTRDFTFQFLDRAPAPPGRLPSVNTASITTGYLRAMGIPLRAGRDFTELDRDGTPRVAMINEQFARRWYGRKNPLGQRICFEGSEDKPIEIIGVVGDVHLSDLAKPVEPMLYRPANQALGRYLTYIVRGTNASSMRAAIRAADPDQPIVEIRTLESYRADSLARRRFNLTLLGILSTIALILAAVGIYSLMSYMVTQRTSEIGIRMALGAGTSDVFRLIVGNALRVVAVGVAVGIAAAFATTRVMSSLLYGVGTNDPATFTAICVVIASVALVASWLPARRASRVDPLVAIRYD